MFSFIRKRISVAAVSTNVYWKSQSFGFQDVMIRRGIVFGRKVRELAS